MPQFPYKLTDKNITVHIDGETHQTMRSNPNWDLIKIALEDPTATKEGLIELMKPVNGLNRVMAASTGDTISIVGGKVMHVTEGEVHSTLTKRMLDVLAEGMSIEPWLAFANKVYANPWKDSRTELYEWLEHWDMPITPGGNFWAYKMVTSGYLDMHSRSFDNSIGQTVVMKGGREAVDANRRNECSHGLHFCSLNYVGHAGGTTRLVIVEIDPGDVVAIPQDFNASKGRCWRYTVVGEIPIGAARNFKWTAVAAEAPVDSPVFEVEGDPDDAPKALPAPVAAPPKHSRAAVSVTRTPVGPPLTQLRDKGAKLKIKGARRMNTAQLMVAIAAVENPQPKPAAKAKKAAVKKATVAKPKIKLADGTIVTNAMLVKLKKRHGSWQDVADILKVSIGQIRGWQKRLKATA